MANPPVVIGPFDNVPAPGSPIKSDWPQEISRYVAGVDAGLIETGSYTPTLSNIAIGSGGSAANSGSYQWVGGYGAAATGLLFLRGILTFGSSGATFPAGNPEHVGLPAGFAYNGSPSTQTPVGACLLALTSNYAGVLLAAPPSQLRIMYHAVSGASVAITDIAASAPAAWAAGHSIVWSAIISARRT